MNAKPIPFNGPMIRALLDGRKDQTRRVVKLPDHDKSWRLHRLIEASSAGESVVAEFSPDGFTKGHVACPYGQPGDLLWVKENWAQRADRDHLNGTQLYESGVRQAWYWADGPGKCCNTGCAGAAGRVRTARFMPRWASRLTLRITDVRVDRVQEISEGDAKSEGVGPYDVADISDDALSLLDAPLLERWNPHRNSFALLWDSINAKRGYGWDANPWCWSLSFDVIHANVDDVLNERVAA